jgi:uncharacterized protein YigA (DUF484 family)
MVYIVNVSNEAKRSKLNSRSGSEFHTSSTTQAIQRKHSLETLSQKEAFLDVNKKGLYIKSVTICILDRAEAEASS